MATGKIVKPITTQLFTFSGQSVAAGAYVDVTIDIAKNGYTPIGVAAWQINGTTRCALLYAAFIATNTLRLRIINASDSSQQSFASSSVTVLYVPN